MLHRREHPRQAPVLERAVAQFWRDHGSSLPTLECDDGSSLRVIYPGRSSAAAGPDFRDAILQRPSGEVLRGDVEIHVRKGGWEAHGHGTDRHYNGVVLHVILHPEARGNTATRLASGVRVPTAALFPRTLSHRSDALARAWSRNLAATEDNSLAGRQLGTTPRPLPLATLPNVRLERLLDRAGDARFLQKSRRFKHALTTAIPGTGAAPAPEDVLYQGLMTALGYGGNSEAFLQLAQGMPLRAIRRALTSVSPESRSGAIATLLLQASGLPLQTTITSEATAASPVVSPEAWQLFRIRPGNHPSRRIIGVAELLTRSWDTGLVAWATGLVSTENVAGIKQALTVAGVSNQEGAFIGGSRAADLAVNVVLPFVHVWAKITNITPTAEGALSLYRAWPPLQENALTREAGRALHPYSLPETLRVTSSLPEGGDTRLPFMMTARRQHQGVALDPSSLTDSEDGLTNEPAPLPFKRTARRQQGLIHLYKRYFQAP